MLAKLLVNSETGQAWGPGLMGPEKAVMRWRRGAGT